MEDFHPEVTMHRNFELRGQKELSEMGLEGHLQILRMGLATSISLNLMKMPFLCVETLSTGNFLEHSL